MADIDSLTPRGIVAITVLSPSHLAVVLAWHRIISRVPFSGGGLEVEACKCENFSAV